MPSLEFIKFDSTECNFPKPKQSLLPLLSSTKISKGPSVAWRSVYESRAVKNFSRGRYALFDVFRSAMTEDCEIFLPSYHCRTMVDPALELRLRVSFYPLRNNLTPEINILEHIFSKARGRSNNCSIIMVLPDYFGLLQPLEEIFLLCRAYNVQLIEDRSHAMLVSREQGNDRDCGQIIVASPYKFVGSEDGGALIFRGETGMDIQPILYSRGWRAELKGWGRLAFNRIFSTNTDSLVEPNDLSEELIKLAIHQGRKGSDLNLTTMLSSPQFSKTELMNLSLAASRWLIANADLDDLAKKRRENFFHWIDCVSNLPWCKALYSELPDDCVPYMFPLYLENPDKHFYMLKQLGVPIGRWDELATSECKVASKYRSHLIHLPCHQGLDSKAMDWLTESVAGVLNSAGRGVS